MPSKGNSKNTSRPSTKTDKSAAKIEIGSRIANAKAQMSRELNLRGLELTDLAPVAELVWLEELHLDGGSLVSIKPLSQLKSLKKLTLWRTDVTDLTPLSDLQQLIYLDLQATVIADPTPLAKLSKLESLDLWGTGLSAVDFLKDLRALKVLSLSGLKISDLNALSNLTSLQSLRLGGTLVSSVAPLRNLKALTRLDAFDTMVSDISALSGLSSLEYLNLGNTKITDLTPLAALAELEEVHLGTTKIIDIKPLANLAKLKAVSLEGTQVSSLSPLSSLSALTSLSIDDTKVSDLAPMERLFQLETLSAKRAPISNLAPLGHLTKLKVLDISQTNCSNIESLSELRSLRSLFLDGTRVSSISPVSNLTALRSLSLSDTQVSDLAPLAVMVHLIDAANDVGDGLRFINCPLTDNKLNSFSGLDNPECTVKTINYLRDQQGLPPHLPERLDSSSEDDATAEPPAIPAQGPGPHFAIGGDGVVDFAPNAPLDGDGNNVGRLRSLHDALKNASRALADGLAPRANHYPKLATSARKYLDSVNRNVEEIDFAVLYGAFLLLEVAEQATLRDIENGVAPPLDEAEVAALRSLKLLHGPFILATKVGNELVEAAEHYLRSAEEQSELRDVALALAKELKRHPEIIRPDVANFIISSSDAIGFGPHPARSAVFGGTAAKNITIVVVAGAVIATLPLVGGLLAGWFASVPAGVLSFIGFEALKRTAAHDDVAKGLAGALDEYGTQAAEWAQRLPRRTMNRYVEFVLSIEETIRALAGKHSEGPLLMALIDWLKAHAERYEK